MNSAEPGGIIQYPDRLTPEEFTEIALRWREQHQGVANAHRVAIIEGGTWVDKKYTQRDMQFGDLRRLNRDTILGAFGVPMPVMGITEAVNRANAEAGEYLFAKWVVKPQLERYKEAINYSVGKRFGDDLTLVFKDPVPPDPAINLQSATLGYTSGILTINEGRRRLGESPIDGGDILFSGGEAEIIMPTNNVSSNEDYSKSRPYTIKSVRNKDKNNEIIYGWVKRFSDEKKDISKYLDIYYSTNSPDVAYDDPYYEMAQRVLDKNALSFNITPNDLDYYDWNWETRYGLDVQKELEDTFISVFNESLDPDMHQPSDIVVRALAENYANHRMTELLNKGGNNSILSTTRKRIRKLLEDATDLTSIELKEKILSDMSFSEQRAKTIARTEISHMAGLANWKAGVLQGKKEKRWICINGADAGSQCIENEAQGWIPILNKFTSGDYHNPSHPNCDCFIETRGESSLHIQKSEYDNDAPRCKKCNTRYNLRGLKGSVYAYCDKCRSETEIIA